MAAADPSAKFDRPRPAALSQIDNGVSRNAPGGSKKVSTKQSDASPFAAKQRTVMVTESDDKEADNSKYNVER